MSASEIVVPDLRESSPDWRSVALRSWRNVVVIPRGHKRPQRSRVYFFNPFYLAVYLFFMSVAYSFVLLWIGLVVFVRLAVALIASTCWGVSSLNGVVQRRIESRSSL